MATRASLWDFRRTFLATSQSPFALAIKFSLQTRFYSGMDIHHLNLRSSLAKNALQATPRRKKVADTLKSVLDYHRQL